MTASGTKTPTLTALQRGSVVVFAIVLAFAFALSMSAESAFAQPDNGEGAGVLSTASVQNPDGTLAPDAETSETANLEASSADVQASGTNGVDTTILTGNSSASVSENNENGETPEGAQQPTDKYEAVIVVGENQKRDYDTPSHRHPSSRCLSKKTSITFRYLKSGKNFHRRWAL